MKKRQKLIVDQMASRRVFSVLQTLILSNFIVLVIFLALPLSANAQTLRVSSLPGLDFPVTVQQSGSPERRFGFGLVHAQVNENSLIYVVDREGANTKQVYRYDIDVRESTLIHEEVNEFFGFGTGSIIVTDGGLTSLTINGKLFFVDSTVSQVDLIGDFGTFFCCFPGGISNVVGREEFIGGLLYFTVLDNIETVVGGQFATAQSLWRSDGTPAGTFQVSPSIDISPGNRIEDIRGRFSSSAFKHNSLDSNSVFFFTRDSLWQINPDGSIEELLSELPVVNDQIFSTTSLVDNIYSIGTDLFLCNDNLWRLTSQAILELIAIDCNGAVQVGSSLYVYTADGLWFTDGTANSEQLIFPFNGARPENNFIMDSNRYCQIEGDLYFTISSPDQDVRSSLIKVTNETEVEDITTQVLDDDTIHFTLSACVPEGIIIVARKFSSPFFSVISEETRLFKTRNMTVDRIVGSPFTRFGRTLTNLSLPLSRNEDAVFVNGGRYPFFLDPAAGSIMPPILQLLE